MSGDAFDLAQPIFEEPPHDLGEQDFHFGALLSALGGYERIEVARAIAEAGDRLLHAALDRREPWEVAHPILFWYRHALELHLKALLPDAGFFQALEQVRLDRYDRRGRTA